MQVGTESSVVFEREQLPSLEDRLSMTETRLEQAERLMCEAACLVHFHAPPRVATETLVEVRDFVGRLEFDEKVLQR